MPKYKLCGGYRFDVAPIPVADDRAGQLLEFVMGLKETDGQDVGLIWGRDSLIKIMQICCPDALPRMTLADVVGLMPCIKEMISDAWGAEMVPVAGGAESKNGQRPSGS